MSKETYDKQFECLKAGEKRTLKDEKSECNSYIPVQAKEETVYIAKPDGDLIPDDLEQQKCDYVVYCPLRPQTCFIELKGENIEIKTKHNPFDQILDTICYMQRDSGLKKLVQGNVEKHAFIVSPGRQKIPKGVETKERQLWQKLVQPQNRKGISELIHYVKVTKNDRYSSHKQQIVCSVKAPVEIPFEC